jgi:hypothetical protein
VYCLLKDFLRFLTFSIPFMIVFFLRFQVGEMKRSSMKFRIGGYTEGWRNLWHRGYLPVGVGLPAAEQMFLFASPLNPALFDWQLVHCQNVPYSEHINPEVLTPTSRGVWMRPLK